MSWRHWPIGHLAEVQRRRKTRTTPFLTPAERPPRGNSCGEQLGRTHHLANLTFGGTARRRLDGSQCLLGLTRTQHHEATRPKQQSQDQAPEYERTLWPCLQRPGCAANEAAGPPVDTGPLFLAPLQDLSNQSPATINSDFLVVCLDIRAIANSTTSAKRARAYTGLMLPPRNNCKDLADLPELRSLRPVMGHRPDSGSGSGSAACRNPAVSPHHHMTERSEARRPCPRPISVSVSAGRPPLQPRRPPVVADDGADRQPYRLSALTRCPIGQPLAFDACVIEGRAEGAVSVQRLLRQL